MVPKQVFTYLTSIPEAPSCRVKQIFYISNKNEVEISSPDQGLSPIPASKKWGSGTDPRVQKIMLWDQSLRLLVLWSQNSIFSVLGFDPRTRNCYLWDQMLSSNTISSPCGELMGLWPMLLPNLTQYKTPDWTWKSNHCSAVHNSNTSKKGVPEPWLKCNN